MYLGCLNTEGMGHCFKVQKGKTLPCPMTILFNLYCITNCYMNLEFLRQYFTSSYCPSFADVNLFPLLMCTRSFISEKIKSNHNMN